MKKMVNHVLALEAYTTLQQERNVHLIDVRTHSEQVEYGVPKPGGDNKPLITLSLTDESRSAINQAFLVGLQDGIKGMVQKTDKIFFICKSGQRSEIACNIAMECGYINAHNINSGFCGSHPNSWKASSLPWEYIAGN